MRKKIGELLVEAGATTSDEVKAALSRQRSWGNGKRLGEVLVATGKVTPAQVARALAAQFEVPFIVLPDVAAEASKLVPVDFQAQNKLVAFALEVDGKAQK